MISQQAIEKAIEGGWHKEEKPRISENNDGLWVEFDGGGDTRTLHESDIALDPTFWQTLGKALGWVSGCNICLNNPHSYAEGFAEECKKPSEHLTSGHKYPWEVNAHRFYGLILTDGDTEKFWEEIIDKKGEK